MRFAIQAATALVLVASGAAAREPEPHAAVPDLAGFPLVPAPWQESPGPVVTPRDTRGEPGGQPLLAVDLLLGMETGVRAQLALSRTPERAFVAEAYYGALLTQFGALGCAGAGGRAVFRRGWADSPHSFLLGPGVDVLYGFRHDGPVLLAPTVDLAWYRCIGPQAGWEMGLSIGAGFGVSGKGTNGRSAEGEVTPLISVYTGCRF